METPNIDQLIKEDRLIDLGKANIMVLLLTIPVLLIFGLPYYFIWIHGQDVTWSAVWQSAFPPGVSSKGLFLLLVTLIGIVVHEGIHGITWALFASRGFRSIQFGVMWKMLTPYCHCNEPLKVREYIIGALMPALLLGFIPAILGLVSGHPGILMFGMFFLLAAGGDFMIVALIRKEHPDTLVQDHPSEAGCSIYKHP